MQLFVFPDLLMFAQQILAQRCAFAMASPASSTAHKVGGALIFALWPVGYTYFVYVTIRQKVLREHRAQLVKLQKRTGGFLRYVYS